MLGWLIVALGCPPAWALNLVMNFNCFSSASPTFDPIPGGGGVNCLFNSTPPAGLQNLFAHAESFYQDVFEDAHTLTINYWYSDLDDSTLGVHSLVSQSGGREIEANIRIDTRVGSGGAERNWFIDPSPANNSEFDMQQTLWRDLSTTSQSDFYNFGADIPSTFEVGFTGSALSGGAVGATDMLSVVMHEVGHALGMSSANTSTQNQTADGDYDYNSAFVFGRTLAVETANNSGDDNLNIAHLESNTALMTPSVSTSLRRLPSHTDLFAMASGHSYVNLDVPRREFYGNSNWQNDGNWSGNTEPGAADDVYVRDARGPSVVLSARLNANGFAGNLFVSEGGNVDTNAFKLDVSGDVTVTGLDSDVFVDPGGELEADEVFIQDQAEVEMSGGLLDVRRVTTNAGTQVQSVAAGAVTVDVSERFVNNGAIDADGGSVMTLVSTAANPWDLDGTSGDGIVDATGGDIIFASGGLSDNFDGTMYVGAGRLLSFVTGWTNATGSIQLLGGGTTSDTAELQGTTINFLVGTIFADGFGLIDAQTSFSSGVQVSLADADAQLRLGASTGDVITYNGGTFSGPGTLVQNGDATVTSGNSVTIDVGSFDFDGGSISDPTIQAGATMEITSNEISDAHNGIINVHGGTLNVETGITIFINGTPLFLPAPWEMAGQLNLTSNGLLGGVLVNITGDVTTTGRGIIEAPVDFESTAAVNLASSSEILELRARTNYMGGTYTGAGRIEQDGVANVVENTTIDMGLIDWDGSAGVNAETNIHPGRTFTLDVRQIETGDAALDGYDGTVNIDSGTLAVNTGIFVIFPPNPNPFFLPQAWRLDGTMNLINTGGGTPTLNGSPMTVVGTVQATGGLADVNASVSVTTGRIIVDGGATLRHDGNLTNSGGLLRVLGSGRLLATATTTFTAGSAAEIEGQLDLFGTTDIQGGSYTGGGTLRMFGTQTISQPTQLEVNTHFRTGSTTAIDATELRLRNDGRVFSGATINGAGTLHNMSGSTLILSDGSQVDVDLQNDGTVVIGSSPGLATLSGDYLQTATGALDMELGGLAAGTEFDFLRVANVAALDGTLDVSLINAFVPQDGDSFQILRASSRLGTFAHLMLPVLGGGLGWEIAYSNVDVRLSVIEMFLVDVDFNDDGFVDCTDVDALTMEILAGTNSAAFDLDGDALVDTDDLTVWLADAATFNGFGSPYYPGDANLDGVVDVADFNVYNAQKFTQTGAWCQADFNVDGVTDVADFNVWNANKFQASLMAAPLVRIVPEPSGVTILLCLAALLAGAARKRPIIPVRWAAVRWLVAGPGL